ncbi:MAG: 30S ribosomal protein S17 [Candidatus Diapherotrites archaeon]|nr:30S ribosomal protein S17 [Candidatus Diapherotrites archaeon]MDZ4256388.1 30S ribosomal protein S17 [archaeon]
MPKKKSPLRTGKAANLRVRGSEFVGRVIAAKTPQTVTILRESVAYSRKFERYKKVKSKIHAHNPEWINAKENDIVRIGETRKISKTKNFLVTEIIGHTRGEIIHEDMTEGMHVRAKQMEKEKPEEKE